MRTIIKRCLLFLLVMLLPLLLDSPAVQAANNSVKVFLTGTGVGTFPQAPGGLSAFGFWVSCGSDSTNPSVGQCSGAMYVYALQLARPVAGSITELPSGACLISLHSPDGAIVASLTNTPPVTIGPTNTVTVAFSSPSGGGSTTNAVVNIVTAFVTSGR